MTLLSVAAVSISIGGKSICRDLDFELNQGQRWGVLGGNGVGKTTLLKYLAGLLPLAQGELQIHGKPLSAWKRKALAREVGVLFQDSQDTFPTTVMETALSGRHPYLPFWSFEGETEIAIASQALVDVAMADMEDRQIDTLSGGERRRLAIATLIVQNPRIWLLDEPTNHLDLHHQISLLELIIDKVTAAQGALLMVLHDVNLVSRFCTHAMLMVDAQTIICGPIHDVVTRQNLELLYRHPIRHIQGNGIRYFFPE
ncbi:MAG: ABC transporter protein [Gammaproteobacteria bacterium]|nr:ABC transporter protein [Gammaproteobacteria bacterium]